MTKDTDQKTGLPTGRACTKCHAWKPLHDFNKKSNTRLGVYNECRECQKISNRIAHAKLDKTKQRENQQRRRAENPEQRKAWDAAYRARNPEKIKESVRRHYENNPDSKERRSEQVKRWADENPDNVREKTRKSQAKRNKNPEIRIHNAISRGIRKSIGNGGKAGRSTFKILGYSKEEFIKKIESQFQPGMSWGNYGKWHIDHILPVSSFNFTCAEDEDFKRCWALENLQPLWAIDNIKKGNKIPADTAHASSIADNDNVPDSNGIKETKAGGKP